MDLGEPMKEHEISPAEEPVPQKTPAESPDRETADV